MANEVLRDAIHRSDLTVDSLAQKIKVDPKTVARWISSGQKPYRKHMHEVAKVVQVPVNQLWPDGLSAEQQSAVSESEVIATYPRRSLLPSDSWSRLFEKATNHIDILAYVALFLPEQDPTLIPAIKEKARSGTKIRVLLGDPDCAAMAMRGAEEGIGDAIAAKLRNVMSFYRQLAGIENVYIGFHETTLYNSIYRYDDEMLVSMHALGLPGAHAPLMHIRRLAGGQWFYLYAGIFDRVLSESVDALEDQGSESP